jgi:hypothetical protein
MRVLLIFAATIMSVLSAPVPSSIVALAKKIAKDPATKSFLKHAVQEYGGHAMKEKGLTNLAKKIVTDPGMKAYLKHVAKEYGEHILTATVSSIVKAITTKKSKGGDNKAVELPPVSDKGLSEPQDLIEPSLEREPQTEEGVEELQDVNTNNEQQDVDNFRVNNVPEQPSKSNSYESHTPKKFNDQMKSTGQPIKSNDYNGEDLFAKPSKDQSRKRTRMNDDYNTHLNDRRSLVNAY